MRKLDLVGKRFNKLVVLEKTRLHKDNRIGWICQCDCGKKKTVRTNHLLEHTTTSCGCLKIQNNKKHGKRNTSTYNIWANIKQRCTNPNARGYKNYGGRGIKICSEWLNSFNNFLNDMGERPNIFMSIDRIDNDGDYCRENCRWSDRKTQNRNSRHCQRITFNGERLTLGEWSEKLGIKEYTLAYRFYTAKLPLKEVFKI